MGLRSCFGNLLGLNLTRSLYMNTQKNMPIQLHSTLYFLSSACLGRDLDGFTNSAPTDAIVAALACSECHQPGTASVQLPIWL
ncbi:hypothetical protein V6N13_053450 [Hibiscus sabdariffa]